MKALYETDITRRLAKCTSMKGHPTSAEEPLYRGPSRGHISSGDPLVRGHISSGDPLMRGHISSGDPLVDTSLQGTLS